ncbi:Uncharacterised protein [Streptococcus pneumoniae]|nr:Uncharacterised protein [Streptococcus pneumoniae]
MVIEVIQALKGFPHPDRPVHRVASNAQDFFQFLQEIQRLTTVTVQLVHKGKNWNATMFHNLKQFLGLSLDPLGRVHDHDRSIHRHQGTIGIF